MPTPFALCPIALQTVIQRWITHVILFQLEDILQQVVPCRQKGFWKNRSILDHIFKLRALWDHMDAGFALSVDFSNAYPTIRQ